jgi:hypothetical protein
VKVPFNLKSSRPEPIIVDADLTTTMEMGWMSRALPSPRPEEYRGPCYRLRRHIQRRKPLRLPKASGTLIMLPSCSRAIVLKMSEFCQKFVTISRVLEGLEQSDWQAGDGSTLHRSTSSILWQVQARWPALHETVPDLAAYSPTEDRRRI